MAVKIIEKTKLATAEQLVSEEIVLPETVDEYGTLKTKLTKKQDKIAPLAKQVATLEKGMIGAVDAVLQPAEKISLMGSEYEVKLAAQGKRTELSDAEKLLEIVGLELFLKLVSVKVADLKAYLTPDQLAQVTTSSYAIKRRMKLETI